MGLVDWLFGKRQTTNAGNAPVSAAPGSSAGLGFGPEFATDEAVVVRAFVRVMRQIDVAQSIKDALQPRYVAAHRAGDPRQEVAVVRDALTGSNWKWPEIETWADRFRSTGKWPYMWEKYPALIGPPQPPELKRPSTAEKALGFLSVKELRSLLSESGTRIKPAPRKREEFVRAILGACPPSLVLAAGSKAAEAQFQEATEDHQDEVAAHQTELENARIAILAHTLTMTAYHLRDHVRHLESVGYGERAKLRADAVGNCRVEMKYAALFNRGEITDVPPFFPGDRTGIRSVSR